MTSVLLLSDQKAGRFPDRCVLTGETTGMAVNIWAIESAKAPWLIGTIGYLAVALFKVSGKGATRIAVPISQRRWGIWKRRANLCAIGTAAGFGFALAGFMRPSPAMVVVGIVFVLTSGAARMRALQNFWFSAELRTKPGHILISPTHPDFDSQARKLFRR